MKNNFTALINGLVAAIMVLFMQFPASATINNARPLQDEIYLARDKVLSALIHIQPVNIDYLTGKLRKQSTIGSGVIFHKDGYAITNYHVAGKSERIIVTLYDKEQIQAELVGGDPLTDIAVIKLDLSEYNKEVPTVEFGNSDSIQVGQYVLAMGSPLALARSVSCGVISTVNRYFPADLRLPTGERTGIFNNWIQTDAAINPGNSGGPLVNLDGKVVGINSRATMFANNIAFSIPINIVKEVVAGLLKDKKVTRSWIGIQCQEMQDFEGWFGTERDKGVLVASVDVNSPAEEAGLMAGDIILRVNDRDVSARFAEELPTFYKMIADCPIGSKLDMTVLRGEKQVYIDVITHEMGEIMGEDFECAEWGFTVKAITKQMALENQLEDTLGVFVSGVKNVGEASEGGLQRGDVIRGINEEPVLTFDEFHVRYENLANAKAEKILLTVKRFGSTKFILFKVDNSESEGANN